MAFFLNSALVCLTTFGNSVFSTGNFFFPDSQVEKDFVSHVYLDLLLKNNKGIFSMRKQSIKLMFLNFIVMLVCWQFKGVLQVSQLGLSVGLIQSYRSTETAVVITFQRILHVTICRQKAERTVICELKFTIQERK